MISELLNLLQISDSFFPTGAFTQSFGLETYVQEGVISSKEDLVEFLTAYLHEGVATSDGLAMVLAYRAAGRGDLEAIIELDQILAAQKLARESREGSARMGVNMLRLAVELFPSHILSRFHHAVVHGEAYGHHSVVFGLVGQSLSVKEEELALAFTYCSALAMVSSAVRLVPIGQRDGQLVLKQIQPAIKSAAAKSIGLSKKDIGSASVALEIRSMQHERLYSRLFMS